MPLMSDLVRHLHPVFHNPVIQIQMLTGWVAVRKAIRLHQPILNRFR